MSIPLEPPRSPRTWMRLLRAVAQAILVGTAAAVVGLVSVALAAFAPRNPDLPRVQWSWSDQVSVAAISAVSVALAYLLLTECVRLVRRWRRGAPRSGTSAQTWVTEATAGKQQATATLVSEMRAELLAWVKTPERLRTDNEFDEMAAVGGEQAEAISRLVAAVIDTSQANAVRAARRDQWLFFIAGLVVSIPVQLLANWIGR